MTTFDAFWAEWPANSSTYSRKGSKAECLKRWKARGLDIEVGMIVRHVRWMKTTEQWMEAGGKYIPAPLVYLNRSEWDGADIPVTETPAEKSQQYLAALDAHKATEPAEDVKARLAEVAARLRRVA